MSYLGNRGSSGGAGNSASGGLVVQPGFAVTSADTGRTFVNATAAAVTLSGANEADLIADGLTLDGGAGVDPAVGANTANIALNDADIAALQASLAGIDTDNATQTELDAVTAAQSTLDTAQDGNITANTTGIATLQTAINAINADNLTQTESDALEAARDALDTAQDALIAANAAAIGAIVADVGDVIPVGVAIMATDTNRPYINNTAGPITLTGTTAADLVADGLELDQAAGGGTPSSVISPASDDAAGAVGVSTDYARADHKHPAQGVSADANNDLTVGSDGLHHYTAPAQIAADDAVAPSSDAAGDGGTAVTFARSDHRHGAQAVSVDAGNDLQVGTDGLHFFQAAAVIDISTTVETVAGNYAGGAPQSAPVTADIGDLHIELYDDLTAYFTATAVDTWPAAAQNTVTRGTPESLEDFMGRAATFAALPAGVQRNDYAILEEDDGTNLAGVYVWTGAAYEFGFPLVDVIKKGGDLAASATVQPNAEYTVSAGAVVATLPAANGTDAEANDTVFFAVHTGGSLSVAVDAGDSLVIGSDTTGAPGDVLIARATAANTWTVKRISSAGSEDIYSTLAELPDPTTLLVGSAAVVSNDGTASNNGRYTVVGADSGNNGTGWVK